MRAAKSGDVVLMRLLLDHGADPKLRQKNQNTLLILAADSGGGSIRTPTRKRYEHGTQDDLLQGGQAVRRARSRCQRRERGRRDGAPRRRERRYRALPRRQRREARCQKQRRKDAVPSCRLAKGSQQAAASAGGADGSSRAKRCYRSRSSDSRQHCRAIDRARTSAFRPLTYLQTKLLCLVRAARAFVRRDLRIGTERPRSDHFPVLDTRGHRLPFGVWSLFDPAPHDTEQIEGVRAPVRRCIQSSPAPCKGERRAACSPDRSCPPRSCSSPGLLRPARGRCSNPGQNQFPAVPHVFREVGVRCVDACDVRPIGKRDMAIEIDRRRPIVPGRILQNRIAQRVRCDADGARCFDEEIPVQLAAAIKW